MGSPPNGLPLRKAVLATASVCDGSAKAEKEKKKHNEIKQK